jgi:hypothetical protein
MRTRDLITAAFAVAAVAVPMGASAPAAVGAAPGGHARPAPTDRAKLHHLIGLRSGHLVVFVLRGLRGCAVSSAHLRTTDSQRRLAEARLKAAIRRGVLIVRARGRHASLEVRCASTRAPAGKPVHGGGATNTNGTLLFNGTFGSSSCTQGSCPAALANWPSIYGNCYGVLGSTQAQFDVSSSCDPAGDGNFRTDLCSSRNCDHNMASGDYYVAGQGTCTSIPVRFPNGLGTIPYYGWFQFAETKDNEAWGSAGWEMDVSSQLDGVNEFGVAFQFYNDGGIAWFSGPIDTGWHTLSICTNNADNQSGQVWSIWLDGARQTFNQGPGAGSQSIGGFPIIYDGTSWPLDINDYTGQASGHDVNYPYPTLVVHGAPLISSAGPGTVPPEPPGGWNSP